MRAVIYARVSTVEQVGGYSLDAQIEACRDWANRHNYAVARVFVEPGKSAKTDDRPEFQAMIDYACSGNIGGVIFHKVDRFARNLFDILRYKQILTQNGVKLLSVTESIINEDSAETELFLTLLGAFAQYRSHLIGLEAQKGTDQAVALGQYPGSKLALGYHRVGEKRIATIQIHPEQGQYVLAAFREYASGQYTLTTWTAEAKARGYHVDGKPISRTVWGRVLRHRFYLGQFEWKGQIHQGNHDALVTPELWQEVQDQLNQSNSGGRQRYHFWLLKGLLWSTVHQRPMHGETSGQRRYYRAKGRGHNKREHLIPADLAEARVVGLLDGLKCISRGVAAPDNWLLAMVAVPNLGHLWGQFRGDEEKQDFLNLVFIRHTLHVSELNTITISLVRPGFEVSQ